MWFKIANITHELLVPVYRQTDFPPERVDVSRLHDTVAKSRTGVKFSPRCDNRDELTPGRLAPAWCFVVESCTQIQSHEREPEWTRPGAKVAQVSCKHLLRKRLPIIINYFVLFLIRPVWYNNANRRNRPFQMQFQMRPNGKVFLSFNVRILPVLVPKRIWRVRNSGTM